MSDFNQTVDRPYGQQPEVRAAAVRVLHRLDAADLIDMLGLVDEPEAPKPYVVINGRSHCTTCHHRAPSGYCLRNECQQQRRDEKAAVGSGR